MGRRNEKVEQEQVVDFWDMSFEQQAEIWVAKLREHQLALTVGVWHVQEAEAQQQEGTYWVRLCDLDSGQSVSRPIPMRDANQYNTFWEQVGAAFEEYKRVIILREVTEKAFAAKEPEPEEAF